MKQKDSLKKRCMNLKELRERPRSYTKYEQGVYVHYDRFTNKYSFDLETGGYYGFKI